MIVADASAIVEILLRTRLAGECQNRLLSPGEPICAPYLLDIEVAQVLRRYTLSSDISPERGREALEDLLDFPITRYPHEPFLMRIWQLRHSLSAYDAAYVVLAEILDASLVTCDGRIARSHGHHADVYFVE